VKVIEKQNLLKPRLAEEDYHVDGVGDIRIRALSWEECSVFQKWTKDGKDPAEVYRRVLALALVDPSLTEADATVWMGNSPAGEIETLVAHILTRSGLVEGAQKSP
jgi:hypothetical protein